jgi:outer membrane protein OmpA-like peptidoglycan-associated protein
MQMKILMNRTVSFSVSRAIPGTAWLRRIACAAGTALLLACQTAGPAPERPQAPAAPITFERAIDFAVDDLLIQLQRLPEFQAPTGIGAVLRKDDSAPKVRLVVDNAVDGVTGQQTVATRALDKRLLDGVAARFPVFQVSPISAGDVAASRFILTTAVTLLTSAQDAKSSSYRLNMALTDSKNGLVVAQASARATGETVDSTPTPFYRDSPSLVKDRTVEGQIRTAQAAPGTPADGVYIASLSVAALISEGSRLYEAGEYAQALAVYEAAAARPDGRHLRVFNGLYLSNIQLNRADGAEAAFARLVLLGLTTNSLAVKFLFKPGSTDFWPDPKINAAYPMWIRVVARESLAAKACITVAGHTSRTGSDQANERLSMSRAVAIQKRLEGAAPEIAARLQSAGFGFRENLVGTGSDDVRDALDRRVEFRVRSC